MEGCATVVGAYIPRIGDRELVSRLESAGAVLIEAPRACGNGRRIPGAGLIRENRRHSRWKKSNWR